MAVQTPTGHEFGMATPTTADLLRELDALRGSLRLAWA